VYNRYCINFNLSGLLSIFILCASGSVFASSAEDYSITIPPGGYAWAFMTDSAGFSDFKAVNTLAPGPLTGSIDMLPDSVIRAIGMCDELMRSDLEARFTDLLYKVVDDNVQVFPAFADVNEDGLDDLVLADNGYNVVRRIFLAPNWGEIDVIDEYISFEKYHDINNDGYRDSSFISDTGKLILYSGGSAFQVTEGFNVQGIAGTALGDMEGDGLADLVVGTDAGNILIFRNRGSVAVPCFLPFSSESLVTLPMNAGAFSSPVVFSFGDSLLIAAVGTQQNGLKFFGSMAGETAMSGHWTELNSINPGDLHLNISPVAVELLDETVLICGMRNGFLYQARPESDSFSLLSLPPVPGKYPSLALASVNGDEYPDLIAGTMEGSIFYLPGCEGWFDGNWEKITDLPGIHSGSPAVWRDGLVIGTRDGDIRYFVRDDSGIWVDSSLNSAFRNIDVGNYSTPDFADINNDGVDELIVGNSRGDLTCFELNDDAELSEPLFIERFSWKFEPNSAVSEIQSYYSRYFAPFSVFRSPTGIEEVNAFAGEILQAEPQHRDEIAYCISSTPVEVLRVMFENGDTDLFAVNASEMYELAEKLDYVRLLDTADATVCQLKTANGWMELSRENYYHYVVHPRILFETPARINTEYWSTQRDTALISLDEWLNHEPDNLYGDSEDHHFWRQFIPMNNTGGRILEERMMEADTYEEAVIRICNFQSHSQPEGLMSFGYLTNDLQPMVIYRKAYGSCGEQSILQTALCRAFFIPAYVVGCRGEDHQWNHYLDPESGRWNHWDINYGISGVGNVWVSGEGVNHEGKTISTITAFGPDNEVWPVTTSVLVPPGSGYMPEDSGYTHTARVNISVIDPEGIPVEGAMVLARSHWDNANSVSEFNYTDEAGECTFQLGWEPHGGYTIDIISPFGSAGSSNISFQEGETCFIQYTVPARIPRRQEVLLPENGSSLSISAISRFFPVPYFSRSLYSISNDDGAESYRNPGWTLWRSAVTEETPIYMNAENYGDYRKGLDCRAVRVPFIPQPGDTCFAVLDNRNSIFTWREFDQYPLSGYREAGNTAFDTRDWLNKPIPFRSSAATPQERAIAFAAGDNDPGWIKYYEAIELSQDDPADPLSTGYVIGPFRVPSGERSMSIGASSSQSGLDMDLFLFVDRNGNRSVDDMSELLASSTSPTSSESISLIEPDTSAAHWIFLHGWQVPEDGAYLDLGLSFEPEMLEIFELNPTGYQNNPPHQFSFMTVSDTLGTGDIHLLWGSDSITPVRDEESWNFPTPLHSTGFEAGTVLIVLADGTMLDNINWNVSLDSIPPEIEYCELSVDSLNMELLLEVICTDELSGIRNAVSSIDSAVIINLALREDSIWNCSIDIEQFSDETVSVAVNFTDSAGNETSEIFEIDIPLRPDILFRSIYPTGSVFDHRPVLQVSADFQDELPGWNAAAAVFDSSGTMIEELSPIVIDGTTIQFRSDDMLVDGSYDARVQIIGPDGSIAGERSWWFTVITMASTF